MYWTVIACKELYDNIIHCNLNYNEEVESVLLSDAIRYSIETKGRLLNKKLKEKATEFGGIFVSMAMYWTVIVLWPNFQSIRNSRELS
jgi:hypothetical protein